MPKRMNPTANMTMLLKREIGILEQRQIDDRVGSDEFPDDAADDPDGGQTGEDENEIGAEPVVFLSFIQHHLQRSKANGDEAEAEVIDFDAFLDAFLSARRWPRRIHGAERRRERG